MIIVKIYGGMANQLFQYAAGYALALKHNVPLKLDLSYFNETNTDTKRVFELSKFSINYQLASQDEIDQVFKFHKFSALQVLQHDGHVLAHRQLGPADFVVLHQLGSLHHGAPGLL